MAAPPPPRGGLSLYDNLADPNDPSSSSATISSAPVLYNQADASAAAESATKKPVDPALRFQPIRRPQAKQAKPKTSFPKGPPAKASAGPGTPTSAATPAPTAAAAVAKSTLADWAATEEDEWRYASAEKRQRGGRKKKKKRQHELVETDWDELYDPTRPTNVEEYLKSDEKVDEVREWRTLLYRHRKRRDESDMSDDEDVDARPAPPNQFAPPPPHAFAPPPPSPPRPPPDDATGDDAYSRRQALSQGIPPPPPSPPKASPRAEPPPPPPPPTPSDAATISRAPVRYTQPSEPQPPTTAPTSPPPTLESPGESEPATRSSRPGQAGFAQRLMSKYGWTRGTGLGADETGIVNPLRVQVEKRRRRADADGGGWAEPGGKGKIIDGGGARPRDQDGGFGAMSEVIVLRNMLENMPDLQAEIEAGLGQEIGEECGEKYGRVERLYVDQHLRQVFIKFTNQVSALRAVNELDGRVFNGNAIVARFYDTEKFEKGLYT